MDFEETFLDLVRKNQLVILAAETGAGKSTLAPLALLRAGFAGGKMIAVTEPRRVAATNLCDWVAQLYGTEAGEEVGYHIGQDRLMSDVTQLVYKTEGVLLGELHSDPLLSKYGVIVLDEVHERGVNQDLLLALVKEVLPKRPDLKVVVMSATIDTDKFSKYFNDAPVLLVPGRVFPVEVQYARETPEDLSAMIEAVVNKTDEILFLGKPGDILIFMPDQDSIMKVVKGLEETLGDRAKALRILPLFGAQAPDDQKAVFKNDGRRRIIVSTNIAETSLTIDGVQHVVDSGLIKASVYVDANMSALQITEHSRAGCDQRKGRAGRTQEGTCYRLFTEADYTRREGFTKPEILRMSLDQVLLKLYCLHYSMKEVLALDLMDKPKESQWKQAEVRLQLLGAVNATGNVTKDGKRMSRFQVEPMIGRMILEGERLGCLEEILTIAACLTSTRPIFVYPKGSESEANLAKAKFNVPSSDMLTMLKVWNAWDDTKGDHRWARDNFLSSKALSQIDRIRDNLLDLLEREEIKITSAKDELALKKAITAGLIVNLARKDGRYSYTWNERETFVFPGSSLMGTTPQYVVCVSVVESTGAKGPRAYMRGVHTVETSWLAEVVPEAVCKTRIEVQKKSYSSGELVVSASRSWNGMEFEQKMLEEIPRSLAPSLAVWATKQLVDGYGNILETAPQLTKLWKKLAPATPLYLFGDERKKLLQPMADQFTAGIEKKIAGMPTIYLVLHAMNSLTAEDVLTGEALVSYKKQHAEEIQREAQAEVYRAQLAEANRVEREKKLVALAPMRTEFEQLDGRVCALGYVLGQTSGLRLTFRDDNVRLIARGHVMGEQGRTMSSVRFALDDYKFIVERLESENAPKLAATQLIYASVRKSLPVCPVCGGAWNESFVCTQKHAPNQFIAQSGQDDWLVGKFNTVIGDQEVASVHLQHDQSIKIHFVVRESQMWHGRPFTLIAYQQNLIILSESQVENREMIVDYLAELNKAKKALEAEISFVEGLKKKVSPGSVVRLQFSAGTNGLMVADYKHEQVEAPYDDDLNRYPKAGETWWCHVISSNNNTKIALYRKVGTTKADVDRVIADITELFPELPPQLIH